MPETTRAEIADTGLVEAVLFAAGNPVPVKELAAILELDVLGTQNILTRLQQELDERHSGLTLRQVAGGYQLATRPEAFATVERLSQVVDRK
ncbi:MAG: SMC-Scp complex subunit ScpB, partial [Selenomonas sp.]|nr:SMC-Scp complex subunit ScpB [Selenomonas sp.]